MVTEFVLYGNRTILFKSFVSASFLRVLLLSLCHPAIIVVIFVVRRSFVLSFSLHIRPCSLLSSLPLFFACCCCFFCASPFSFRFPCFSLLFVRALCLFSVAFWRVAVFSVPRLFCSAFRSSRCYLCASFALFSIAFCFIVQQTQKACYMFNSSTNGKT